MWEAVTPIIPGGISRNKRSVNDGAGHGCSSPRSQASRGTPALWDFCPGKLHRYLCPASFDLAASSPHSSGRKGSYRWVLAQLCFLVKPLDVIHGCKKTLCTQLFVYLLVFLIHICSRNHLWWSTASYHSLPHCALCANCLLYTMIFHVFSYLSVNFKAFPSSWNLSPKSQHSGWSQAVLEEWICLKTYFHSHHNKLLSGCSLQNL